MSCAKKAGPEGPSQDLIQAIIALKSRNPRFGCPRIAHIISQTFGVDIDKNVVYRVLAKHYRPALRGTGPLLALTLFRNPSDRSSRILLVRKSPIAGRRVRPPARDPIVTRVRRKPGGARRR
jgi:hypothetical protein